MSEVTESDRALADAEMQSLLGTPEGIAALRERGAVVDVDESTGLGSLIVPVAGPSLTAQLKAGGTTKLIVAIAVVVLVVIYLKRSKASA